MKRLLFILLIVNFGFAHSQCIEGDCVNGKGTMSWGKDSTLISCKCTQGGSRTHTHIVHYDLNVARLPIPALGYLMNSCKVINLLQKKSPQLKAFW